jgi:hypothetical protein
MERNQMCIANVQYKKPTANETKRAKGLLNYLTYREGRNEGARQASGRDRWEDHGLGGSVADVARNCEALKSKHVLLFSLVYNVNPDLMAMVPPAQREAFVRELTVQTTEAFFEARGIDTGVEWAYVVHHRMTDNEESPGQHDPHTHVVLPGTVFDDDLGERVPLYFSKNKSVDHITMLHGLTERQMEVQMERYVGVDWEGRYDALQTNRTQQMAVPNDEPHGILTDGESDWVFWCGVRQTDERNSAAGYYRYVPLNETESELQFRPLVLGLAHDEADLLARLMRLDAHLGFDHLKHVGSEIERMTSHERREFFDELRGMNIDIQPPSRDRDLDIGL